MVSLRACALTMLLFACATPACAGISACPSYATYSPDGTRILVMIGVPSHERDPATFTLASGRVVDIRQTFPSSGCYDALTLKPIWQVKWYSLRYNLLTSPDLRYVVYRGQYAKRGGNALEFYDNGNLTRAYACDDLLRRHVSASGF